MASPESSGDDRARELDREIERYRQAAIDALGQLEWVVGYLREARKTELAKAVDRNRRQIWERIA
jgi:hypothetical protein